MTWKCHVTSTARRRHSRNHLRYETNMTDAEWVIIESMLPSPLEEGVRRNGRCTKSSMRCSISCRAAFHSG